MQGSRNLPTRSQMLPKSLLYIGICFISMLFLNGCTALSPRQQEEGASQVSGKLILPKNLSPGSPMSENQVVWVALLNNAAFQEAVSNLGLSQADLLQAQTLPNPILGLFLPVGPKQLEFGLRHSVETIWLRPKRIKLAELDLERASRTLGQSSLDLVRDVRLAYTELVAAKERVVFAKQALELSKESAKITKARFQAGAALELEVTTVTSAQLQAKQELNTLEYEVPLAAHRLSKLLGLGVAEVKIMSSALPKFRSLSPNSDRHLKEAFAARPDLRASELEIERAFTNAGLVEVEAYQLIVFLDANGSGKSFEAGPGFEFPIPLFDQNKAAKSRAKTMIASASKRYLGITDC
jgi:hypothetical protein